MAAGKNDDRDLHDPGDTEHHVDDRCLISGGQPSELFERQLRIVAEARLDHGGD